MAKLDSPELQDALVRAASISSSAADNAREIGMSRQSVHAYLRKHPDLRSRVDVAHRRTKIIAHHAPRTIVAEVCTSSEADGLDGDEGDGDGDGDLGVAALTPTGRHAFLALLHCHADDAKSRGCAKALEILARLHFAPELIESQARARRAAAEIESPPAPMFTPGDSRAAIQRALDKANPVELPSED